MSCHVLNHTRGAVAASGFFEAGKMGSSSVQSAMLASMTPATTPGSTSGHVFFFASTSSSESTQVEASAAAAPGPADLMAMDSLQRSAIIELRRAITHSFSTEINFRSMRSKRGSSTASSLRTVFAGGPICVSSSDFVNLAPLPPFPSMTGCAAGGMQPAMLGKRGKWSQFYEIRRSCPEEAGHHQEALAVAAAAS